MTTTIHDAYINALLADATYAINQDVGPNTDLENLQVLKDRMTSVLAKFIGDNFTVVTHLGTDDSVIGGTGFDATVWHGKDGTEYAGKAYLSMTGTEGPSDFITDLDLTLSGAAKSQIVDMVNWWLKNSTESNQTARQIQFVDGAFTSASSVFGTGLLHDVSNVMVNGHSLGGHLATAFTRLFGGQLPVDHTYTYNSAGFTTNSEQLFQQIETLLGIGVRKGYFEGIVGQSNFFAENGISATTRTFLNGQEGLRTPVFNEESSFPIDNHYMYKLTDALALGDAIAKLDSTFGIAKMNELFEKSANQTEASLENILDGLRATVLGGPVTATPIGDIDKSAASRVGFYQNLTDLTISTDFKSLIGMVTIVAPPTSADAARDDFGAFLSLVNLTPFALKPNDDTAASILKNINSTNSELALKWAEDSTRSAEVTCSPPAVPM